MLHRTRNIVLSLAGFSCALLAARPAQAGCGSDAECKGDRICVEGECQAPQERAPGRCASDVDCPGDNICQDQLCVSPQSQPAQDPEQDEQLAPDEQAAPQPRAAVAPSPSPTAAPPAAHGIVVGQPTSSGADEGTGGREGLGMLVGGLSLFAGMYALTLPITAVASEDSPTGSATEYAAIPLFGPFVILGEHEEGLTGGGIAFYLLSGAVQITGAAMAIVGGVQMGTSREVGVTVVPGFDPKTGSASLSLGGPLDL